MTRLQDVDRFIAEFRAGPDSPDPDRKDHWRILTEPPYVGDCEDFALTVAYILAGRSMEVLQELLESGTVELWFVRATTANTTEGPHAVLRVRGVGWMDNLDPVWRPDTPHRKRYRYPPDYVMAKLRGETPPHPRSRSKNRTSTVVFWVAIAVAALMALRAWGHETATGWTYELECCGGIDCGAARIGHVLPSQEGWRIKLSPGDHHFFPGALDTVVPYGDPRLRRSQDTEFHLCLNNMGRVLCLYVPPLGG